jgi:glycosyltransferase involved in cell wall biosynthesis
VTSLTAAIIARDEQALIGECLDSLSFADERLVLVDAATTDRTRELARARGARVEERAFDNFAGQRDAALALASGNWVLFVDADERVTADLRAEVLATIEAPGDVRGFWIPRDNVILGRVVRCAGWYPDYQLRLLERQAARFDRRRVVHELAIVDGGLGHLRSPLVHLNYRTLGEFVRKQERYAQLEAQSWLLTYGRPRLRAVLGQGLREFWRRFVVLRGYREGALGALLSALLALYTARAVWLARRRGSQALDGVDHADARQKIR